MKLLGLPPMKWVIYSAWMIDTAMRVHSQDTKTTSWVGSLCGQTGVTFRASVWAAESAIDMHTIAKIFLVATLCVAMGFSAATAASFEQKELSVLQLSAADEGLRVSFHAVLDVQRAASLVGTAKYKVIDFSEATALVATLGRPSEVAVLVRGYRSEVNGPIFASYKDGLVVLTHTRVGYRVEGRIQEVLGVVFVPSPVIDVASTTRYVPLGNVPREK